MIREEVVKSALKKVYDQRLNWGFIDRFTVDENEVVADALEKQIPKKPELWHNQPCPPEWADDDWGYRCPACGNEEIDYPEHHCVCGQAIDWSDET